MFNHHRKSCTLLTSTFLVVKFQVHRGVISVIWECVHRTTCLRYAVKVVDRRRLNRRGKAAIYREVKMLAIIDPKAPGTIHLHQFFDEPTHFYIVTEYASGGNLQARIDRKQNICEDETKRIMRCVLECLVYQHKRGIVHRNIKPDNIVLEGTTAMIVDYRHAAKLMYSDTGEMVMLTAQCGTSSYVAPEMLNKQPYSSQVDIWGVGILAYMCLAGYYPFSVDSKQAVYERISKGSYTFETKDWASISGPAKHFISSLLHVDPDVRMTAEEALQHPWLAFPIHVKPVVEEFVNTPVTTKRQSSTMSSGSNAWTHFPASRRRTMETKHPVKSNVRQRVRKLLNRLLCHRHIFRVASNF